MNRTAASAFDTSEIEPLAQAIHDALTAAKVDCSGGRCIDAAVTVLRAGWARQPRPRVWRDGDDIPAGTWVLDDDGRVDQVDEDLPPDEPVRCWLGTVVEVLPPAYEAEVARATAQSKEES